MHVRVDLTKTLPRLCKVAFLNIGRLLQNNAEHVVPGVGEVFLILGHQSYSAAV
jgi:hypothetical protein